VRTRRLVSISATGALHARTEPCVGWQVSPAWRGLHVARRRRFDQQRRGGLVEEKLRTYACNRDDEASGSRQRDPWRKRSPRRSPTTSATSSTIRSARREDELPLGPFAQDENERAFAAQSLVQARLGDPLSLGCRPLTRSCRSLARPTRWVSTGLHAQVWGRSTPISEQTRTGVASAPQPADHRAGVERLRRAPVQSV
jgi:hypothetical protein